LESKESETQWGEGPPHATQTEKGRDTWWTAQKNSEWHTLGHIFKCCSTSRKWFNEWKYIYSDLLSALLTKMDIIAEMNVVALSFSLSVSSLTCAVMALAKEPRGGLCSLLVPPS